MIKTSEVQDFLAQRRLAVVGVSSDPKGFGNTIHRELLAHGYDAVAVGRASPEIPDDVDGVIVMVDRESSADVVRQCVDRGISRIWLFQGIGGPGAVSDAAVALGRQHGATVIAGACPLMFLEPVGAFHKLHRGIRRLRHTLSHDG